MGHYVNSNRILIVEPRHSGHRLEYVHHLAAYAISTKRSVVLATTAEVLISDEFQTHLSRSTGLELVSCAYEDLVSISGVATLARKTAAGMVVIPDADRFAYRFALGPVPRSGAQYRLLLMRSPWTSPTGRIALDLVKKALCLACEAHRTAKLFHLASFSTPPRPSWIRRVPDPVTWSREFDMQGRSEGIELPSGTFWFAVVGRIDERKNVPIIAEALRVSSARNAGLVVAGRQSVRARESIAAALDKLAAAGIATLSIDRMLSDVEISAIVAKCNCVVVAHSNEGPSGVMLKAIAAGTSVVTAGAESLHRDAAAMAFPWSPLDAGSIAASMMLVMSDQEPRRPIALPQPDDFAAALLD